MKQRRPSRRVLSFLLALVMVLTSLPFTMAVAADGVEYDPAPYWASDEAGNEKISSKEVMFSATLNSNGTIEILFPRAFSYDYNDGEISVPIDVQGYIVTLTEIDGGQTSQVKLIDMYFPLDMVEKIENAVYARKVTLSADVVSEAFEKVGGIKERALYDVGVTAIDEEYWVSETIHTMLNDIPYYNLTVDSSPEENWVAREMLNFEQRYSGDIYVAGKTISESGTGLVNGVDYVGTNGKDGAADNVGINVDGKFSYLGVENSDGTANTSAFRFWVNGAYQEGKPFSFTTTWSRGHYDFTGADEVWFFVDFRGVNFDVAFTLTANEKMYNVWADGTNESKDNSSAYGTIYSTAAAGDSNKGTKGGIYYQNEMGLWQETTMTDGYLTNLGGYRGYVRIPIDYFVVQENEYITADNDYVTYSANENNHRNFVQNHMFYTSDYGTIYVNQLDGSLAKGESIDVKWAIYWNMNCSAANYRPYNVPMETDVTRSVYRLLVNKAGTPITDCLMLRQRFSTSTNGGLGNQRRSSYLGYMLYTEQYKNDANGTKIPATLVDNGDGTYTYQIDRANGISPLKDMMGAGIQVKNWSADSVRDAFDFDQVLFMRKADANSASDYDASTGAVLSSAAVQFPTEAGNFANDRGYRVGNYYDRSKEVPKAIAAFIDKYFAETPSLIDYYTLEFVDNAIALYKGSFPYPDDFERTMQSLGYADAYKRYKKAQDFIEQYLGEGSNYYDLAWAFEERVELLPDPEFVNIKDPAIIKEVTELAGIYKGFDLDKLNFIGDGSELKFLQIYRMVIGDAVKTGQSVGAYPYIPFNNFENNYYNNEYAFKYYNDGDNIWADRNGSKAVDRNNTGSFTVYSTKSYDLINGSYGWYPRAYNPSGTEGFYGDEVGYNNAAAYARITANITKNGYDGSQGASVNFDGFSGSITGAYNVLSVSYDGRTADNFGNLPGLDLSAIQLVDRTADGTMAADSTRYGGSNFWANSFVMYVDFSQVKNVYMNLQFIVQNMDTGADQVYYYAAGNENADDRIWALDEYGNWQQVTIPKSTQHGVINSGNMQYYKGFIRIALSKFRTADGTILANSLDKVLIKRAHVSFWTDDNSNRGQSVIVDGMGFSYDPNAPVQRISSDPNAALVAANPYLDAVTDLDEFFGAKTDDSKTFAQAVYSLDPYKGRDAFLADYAAALAEYAKLSDYQKTLADVQYAYAYLKGYDGLPDENGDYNQEDYDPFHDYSSLAANYEVGIKSETWAPKYSSAAELQAVLDSLPALLKDPARSALGDRMTAYDTATGTIDYSHYGLIADTWEDIVNTAIEAYELGYSRFTAAQKAEFGSANYTNLYNAYKAALRVREMHEDLANLDIFFGKLTDLYTPTATEVYKNVDGKGKDVKGKDIPAEYLIDQTLDAYTKNADGSYDTSKLDDRIQLTMREYYYMSIFAKYMVTTATNYAFNDTTVDMSGSANALLTVYLNARNRDGIIDASTGAPIKVNESAYMTKLPDGLTAEDGTIPGGIVYYTELAHEIHSRITNQIGGSNYLTEKELKEIEYQIRKFEAFDDCYRTVDSMYNEYLHMVLPFADAEIELRDDQTQGAADISGIGYVFSSDGETTVTSLTNQIYLPHVWARIGRSVTLQISSTLTMKQETGMPQEDKPTISFTVGQLTGKPPVKEAVADGSEETVDVYYSGYIGTFTNRYSASNPARAGYFTSMQVQINADDVAGIPKGVEYKGLIYVKAFDNDDIEADVEKPEPIAEIAIPVRFISDAIFYEIAIPADIEVDFGAQATEAPAIKVISILNKFADDNYDVLKVNLENADAEHTMTMDASELPSGVTPPTPIPTLKYTVGGKVTYKEGTEEIDTTKKTAFSTITVNGTGNYAEADYPLSVWVAEAQWQQAYVNKYVDSALTFTAAYTAAQAPQDPQP